MAALTAASRALPPVDENLQLFDVPLRNDTGVAPLQLGLHIHLILSLLKRTLRLLDLAFRFHHIRLCSDQRRIDFGDLAPGRLRGRFLLGLSSLNITSPLATGALKSGRTSATRPDGFGQNRDRPEEQGRRAGRRVEIENQRDERNREHQAGTRCPISVRTRPKRT